jgi:ABC-type multidrug transport system fused ATPase/permease subunit
LGLYGRTSNEEKGAGRLVLTTLFYGLLTILASVATALAGLMLAQRLIPLTVRQTHNATTATIYAALYVMFGVSVGFSLFLVWQQFNTARQITQNEAASVQRLYRLAQRFPEPERDRVQDKAVSYAKGVVEEEWPSMSRGVASQHVGKLLEELRRVVQEFEPHTAAAQDTLYAEALAELDELEESRQYRLLAVSEGIPYILWVVLVVGGVLTISFTYLFGMESVRLHAVAVAGLTVLVSLILHVIGVLDYPFDSGVRVQPRAFEQFLGEVGAHSDPRPHGASVYCPMSPGLGRVVNTNFIELRYGEVRRTPLQALR